jgi:hypothetical protein
MTEDEDAKRDELTMHIMLSLDKAPQELREIIASAYGVTPAQLDQIIKAWKAKRQ